LILKAKKITKKPSENQGCVPEIRRLGGNLYFSLIRLAYAQIYDIF
jgi:hypothetical protein